MGSLSKNKGNTFERKVAKVLSDRFKIKTGIDSSFRRNIDSGSFFGGKNKARTASYDLDKATMGDLICPTAFRFSVECKHYKDSPSFLSILKQDNKTLDKWLEQAEQDAINASKLALVVAKFNNVPEMAIFRAEYWEKRADMYYKDYAIVLLDAFLEAPDTFFFD